MQNPEQPMAPPEVREATNGNETESAPETGSDVPETDLSAAETGPQETDSPAESPADQGFDGPPPEQKDPVRMKVERILEDNLWDLYRTLPQGSRAKFKEQGEALAATLRGSLDLPKFRADDAYTAVAKWLKTIPRVNPYFLQQEAKIKTDRYVKLRREHEEAPPAGLEDA